MHIEDKHLDIIRNIIKKYPYAFYMFGSRVTGKARPLSDVDLCFAEAIPSHLVLQIEAEFSESDLPYKVDLVDWSSCDEAFKKNIFKDLLCIQTGVYGNPLNTPLAEI